jgi:iron complex outermembrane receptor protein
VKASAVPAAHRRVAALACALAASAVSADDGAATTAVELERIEVVGSRIRRAEQETSQPVLVIDREAIERSGLPSIGDLLQTLTTHGAALNTRVNNGGNGQERLDLRNLGENRSLVLLNGRRLSTTRDGAVDLSAIPSAIIERVEVLRDGASAVYGSDAIAGVVNLHTRERFDGAEASSQIGEAGAGDGRIEWHAFTLGASGDRASLAMNVSYLKQEPIFAGARAISAVPYFGAPPDAVAGGASAGTPNGRFGFGPRGSCAFDPAGGYPANGCPPIQSLTPSNTFDPALGTYRPFDPNRDGFNFVPDNYLSTPYERTAVYLQARYALGAETMLGFDVLANERRSDQQFAASPFQLSVAAVNPQQRFAVPASQVFNPFGQPVNLLSFRPGGLLRANAQDADTLRASASLDGTFEAFDRWWRWDLAATHAEQRVAQRRGGALNLPRLLLALGPGFRDAGGVARCGTPAAPIAGCVPLDPFRGSAGVTQAMLDYLYFVAQDSERSTLSNYAANLTGDLLDLPHGALAMAAGVEYRRERAAFVPDALLRQGNLSAGVVGLDAPLSGENAAREGYVEFAVPLLAGQRFAESLELSLAARYSDYEGFGAATNGKAGLRWAITPGLVLRGNWSQGFRAPNLVERFEPATLGGLVPRTQDPCAATRDPSPATRENCARDGVPGGTYVPLLEFAPFTGGGNRMIEPEQALDRTLGLAFSPAAIAGLDLTLDWYRIRIDDAITAVTAAQLVATCALQGVPEACARTERDAATGELTGVDARRLNSGTLLAEGYDLTIRYGLDSRFGRFEVTSDSNYVARLETEVPRGAPRRSTVGNYLPNEPSWRLRSNLDLAWRRGDFGASVAVRWYSALDEGCSVAGPVLRALCSDPDRRTVTFQGVGENRIPSHATVDLAASWSAPWNATLRAGLRNALDRDPPLSRSTFANSFDPAYPLPGRFWWVAWTQAF